MLPPTDKALLGSVTVLLVGGIVIASAVPAVASSHGSAADRINGQFAQQADEQGWNARLTSDEVVWQSQRAYFNGAEVVNNASIVPVKRASTQARTFQIRSVNNDTLGATVSEFQVNQTGVSILDMANYEPGRYVIVYEDMPISIDDGDAEFATDVSEAAFRVGVQNISASFDPQQVMPTGSTSLEFDSNRDSYVVSVNATGLHQAQVDEMIQGTFDNSSYRNGTRFRVSDGDVEVRVGEAPVDPGRYRFTVNVMGANASDTATLKVGPDDMFNGSNGNMTTGPGMSPGNQTGTQGGNGSMYTDTPGNGTQTPETPTASSPAGEDSPTATTSGDQTQSETTSSNGPGFGLLVGAIALLGAGLLASRRTD
ncbi:MAG: PGF-CTERM sorting domain-containing protein [Halorientalis sp.]